MSLRNLARNSETPYLACKYGFSDLPGYMQCAVCPCAADCDILGNNIFSLEQNNYYTNLRASSIENKATYYQDAEGYWHNAEIDGDGFLKVKKDKQLKIIPRKFACDEGNAMHPEFWRCDTCSMVKECDIGSYRQKIQEHKAEIRAEKIKRTKENVKNFFEKVADTFDKIFKS